MPFIRKFVHLQEICSIATVTEDNNTITKADSMKELKIVAYDDKRHHEGFKKINEQWIGELFSIEPLDVYEISHPMETSSTREATST